MEFALIGLLVGIVIGMTGVGGTTITTPLLLIIGVQPVIAVGTNLMFSFISKFAALLLYWKKKRINWSIVLLLCVGSIPLSLAMSVFIGEIDAELTNQLVKISVGAVVAATAVFTLIRSIIQNGKNAKPNPLIKIEFTAYHVVMTIAFGVLIGILVTLTSIGAGVITLIAILWLYPRLNITTIVGTDLVHALIVTLIAGTGHFLLNHIEYTILGLLLLGSLPGVAIGFFLASKVSERLIRRLMALLLLCIGASMLLNAL
jgi:uncharacterized membrane protein YfcA